MRIPKYELLQTVIMGWVEGKRGMGLKKKALAGKRERMDWAWESKSWFIQRRTGRGVGTLPETRWNHYHDGSSMTEHGPETGGRRRRNNYARRIITIIIIRGNRSL